MIASKFSLVGLMKYLTNPKKESKMFNTGIFCDKNITSSHAFSVLPSQSLVFKINSCLKSSSHH